MSSQSSVCIPTVGNAGRWLWFFSWSKIVILDYALHQNPDAELLALTTVITGIMVYVCWALRASLTTQANPSQGYRSEISGDEALELTRWFQFILIWKQPWTQNIRPPLTLYSLGMTTCWWTEGVRRLRENVVHSPPNLQELLRKSQEEIPRMSLEGFIHLFICYDPRFPYISAIRLYFQAPWKLWRYTGPSSHLVPCRSKIHTVGIC